MTHPQIVTEQSAAEKSRHWLKYLQQRGYRLTGSRRAVVDALAEAERSLTAADLYEIGRAKHKGLGLVSVYRTLEKLEELGLVQRVHGPGGCHAYISAQDGHNHMLVCENCGRVEMFEGDDLKDFTRGLEKQSGFRIHEHWLQFFGLCADCQAA
ncbi:MAG: transcriptional repressor [Anaerolineales bacterium]|nr:transcriptional repressor [Anaerolineales bacterium]